MIDISLILVIWIYILFCLIYLQKLYYIQSVTAYDPKCIRKYINRLKRTKDILISLRRVIFLSLIYHTMSLTVLYIYLHMWGSRRFNPFELIFQNSIILKTISQKKIKNNQSKKNKIISSDLIINYFNMNFSTLRYRYYMYMLIQKRYTFGVSSLANSFIVSKWQNICKWK